MPLNPITYKIIMMRNLMLFIISGILTVLLAACGTGRTDDPINSTPDQSGLLNEFIIMAYSGPPLEEVTLERYREIAEARIEFLVPGNGTFSGEQNLRAMDLGAESGIRIIPIDMRIMPFTLEKDVSIDTMAIRAIANDYKDHPAFAGYVIRDEPSGDLFAGLRDVCKIFREEDPLHEPLINLLPSYGSPTQLGFDDYRTYVRTYIETVKPGLLSYDNYALREPVTWYNFWFNDLTIVREETQKARIPFMVFMQSEGIRGHLHVPNRAEILWQVNTALAYGAQGIGWFSYWTPAPDQGFPQGDEAPPPLVESHYDGMIDINGKRTEVYDLVREANIYLKKAGKGILGWESTHVARYEGGQMVEGGSSPAVTPAGEEANIVIGTFRNGNRKRIVISNSSCEKPASFSLQVSSGWKIDGIFTSIDANPAGDMDSLLDWTMEPGGSVLLNLKPV